MLSGLEAIHRNSVQGTAHEMLNLGHLAHKTAYAAILQDNITDAEREATMCRLRSEADAAWKQMHEVITITSWSMTGGCPISSKRRK